MSTIYNLGQDHSNFLFDKIQEGEKAIMDPALICFLAIIVMLTLIFLGVPIGFTLVIVGVGSFWLAMGLMQGTAMLAMTAWHYSTRWIMVCVPLFILTGMLVQRAGVAAGMYEMLNRWLGRVYGGLAIVTTWACAIFGAITGSSAATAAAMGSIAYPVMKKYKYHPELAAGTLAASGTLGILIPPSLNMIIYAVLTEQSVGRLFIGGIIPGILSALIYALMIYFRARRNPTLGPKGPFYTWHQRWESLPWIWHIALLFLIVIGGIYSGIFSPTEAAGVGAFAAFVIFSLTKRMTLSKLLDALGETGRLSAMILIIIIGALIFSRFIAVSGVADQMITWVAGLSYNRYIILFILILIYFILGMILDVIGMLAVSLPIIFPIVMELGFDPIWFGILITKVSEVALITPPIGVNVYVVAGIAKDDISTERCFMAIFPFFLMDILTIIILIAFPALTLWLPNTMMGQ